MSMHTYARILIAAPAPTAGTQASNIAGPSGGSAAAVPAPAQAPTAGFLKSKRVYLGGSRAINVLRGVRVGDVVIIKINSSASNISLQQICGGHKGVLQKIYKADLGGRDCLVMMENKDVASKGET